MTVIALAGRRIDPPRSPSRFPLRLTHVVRARLLEVFRGHRASALVSSAACGADLIALGLAGDLGLERRVVLPFEPAEFMESSVVDCPGHWERAYQEVIRSVTGRDLVVLAPGEEQSRAYARANEAILAEAVALAMERGRREDVLAVIVWEGKTRGAGDLTAQFAAMAERMGIPVEEVRTSARLEE